MVSLRESLSLLFTADAIQSYQETINHVVKKFTKLVSCQKKEREYGKIGH
jgi:hypothetical protein